MSPLLLSELEQVLARPQLARWVTPEQVRARLRALRATAIEVADPEDQPGVTRDPKDDYLVALARAAGASVIVSGDRDLLEADVRPPVVTPRELLRLLQRS